MSDYLWDRSGKDEEVERLETLLRPLALSRLEPPVIRRRRAWLLAGGLSAAAAAVVVIALFLVPSDGELKEDKVFDFGTLGQVTAEKKSRVRVLRRGDDLVKMRLDVGTVRAYINPNARPRLFQVETPATTCVDLGCRYTLSVDPKGLSEVRVSTGRVAFVDGDAEVYIPAGAMCTAAPGKGSGTPIWEGATDAFAAAVRAYDAAAPKDRVAAARNLVKHVQEPRDTLPVWHLFRDPDPGVTQVAVDALMSMKLEFPPGVTVEATLRRDKATIEAWKEHLRQSWFAN